VQKNRSWVALKFLGKQTYPEKMPCPLGSLPIDFRDDTVPEFLMCCDDQVMDDSTFFS
jgi:hypothetical protein